ncbi:MAG: permease-like cell division protein FtsX, partial [Patescibacteria group bacterium]|nr:permease-like cell division protein FtsX [Patescibacteria group bacterium]
MLTPASRILKFAAQNFWRNIWLSFVAISMIFLMLISLNIIVVINFITESVVTTIEERIDVSIYLKPEASENLVTSLRSYLMSLPQVKDVGYVDPEDALNQFKEKHRDDSDIMAALEEIGSNPLGSTLVVSAKSAEDYPMILDSLDNPAYKDIILDKDFSNQERLIEKVQVMGSKANLGGLALSLTFALIAIMIVFNSVRMTIYTHREEIGIMKLVGASNWFVRGPYLLEGVYACLVALVVTIIVVFPALGLIQPHFAGFFQESAPSLPGYF